MSANTSDPLARLISDMEDSLQDVQGWTTALTAIGGCGFSIEPHGVAMIARGLEQSADDLLELWRAAHALSHPSVEAGR